MRKIIWSWYQPADKAEREALHKELEKRVGREMDCPDLAMGPVISAVVGRVGGKIEHILFVEAEAEVQAGSSSVLTAKQLAEPIRMLTESLQYWHIRMVRAFVPAKMAKAKRGRKAPIERMLTDKRVGFTKENPKSLASFYKWIPQVKKTEAA